MRRLLVLLSVAVLLTGCATTGGGSSPTGTPTAATAVIGLTYIPSVQFSPFYAAEDAGQFPQATLRHHGSNEGLFTAITTGSEQFVVAGGDEMLQARAEGADLVAVAGYYHRNPARIIVPADSSITSEADLRGHSVGIPGRYGTSWTALKLALAQVGLQESDVTISEIGYTQQAALTSRKVDAVVGFTNSDTVSFTTAGTAVREIDPQVPFVSVCLITTAGYAAAHPDIVRQVVAGTFAGMKAVTADPAGALASTATRVPTMAQPAVAASAKAVLTATIPLFADTSGQVTIALDPAAWTTMSQAMLGAGLLKQAVPADQAMTSSFQ